MPPKTKQQKEEEAARLLEEQKKREEEERLRQEELKKYQMTMNEHTGLKYVITTYYLETVHDHQDPIKFTQEYVKQILEMNNCLDQFREIDVQVVADQVLNDYVFANIYLKFPLEQTQILVNIFFLVYTFLNTKFPNDLQVTNQKNLGSKKTKENDLKLFMLLLSDHSVDNPEKYQMKYFQSTIIQSIIDYFTKGYLAHFDLTQYTLSHDQRPLELHVDLDIDQPSFQPNLDDAYYKPIIQDQDEMQKSTEQIEQEQAEDKPHEPTDEELLDPIILEAIEQKLQDAQKELEEQLELRKKEMEDKIVALHASKKGGKK